MIALCIVLALVSTVVAVMLDDSLPIMRILLVASSLGLVFSAGATWKEGTPGAAEKVLKEGVVYETVGTVRLDAKNVIVVVSPVESARETLIAARAKEPAPVFFLFQGGKFVQLGKTTGAAVVYETVGAAK